MDITERFLNYTQFDTQSSEDSETVPSTAKQLVFAEYLKKELEHEGLSDVEMDDKGYIYATLKANTKDEIPTIGFISHYDTSPDCSGAHINARIVENYGGGDILLSEGIISTEEGEANYLDFFDHRAFSDGSPFYPCYCSAFNMSRERIQNEIFMQAEINGGGNDGWKKALRDSFPKRLCFPK